MDTTRRPVVAILGCGRIGRHHASNLRGRARLVFASRREASARAFAVRFGGEAVRDPEAALARDDVRGVVIATPIRDHAELTIAALERDRCVLVEKPLVGAPGELEAVGRALAGRPPGTLLVAENYLYKPSLRALRTAATRIGPIRKVRLAKLTRQASPDWRRGHGALLEGGIHFVALLGALVDETPARIAARFPGSARPERRAEVTLTYPSGVVAEIRYGWDTRSFPGGIGQRSVVEGERGRIVFESNGLYALVVRRSPGRWFRFRIGPFSDLMGFDAMTRDFLRAVRDPHHRPLSDFRRARRDLEIVFEAYRSAGIEPSATPSPAVG